MGVLNATPNSFSDGGNLSKSQNAIKAFQRALADFDIVDVGAESTAAFNASISAKDELTRLERFFFPLFSEMEDPASCVSIDTYRPEVFFEVATWLREFWPKCSLIFNDVSGCVDQDLLSLLGDDSLNFSYVFCHNLSPARDEAGNHMQHLWDWEGEELIRALADLFNEAMESLGKFGRKVYLDPCFGFSKTREQNHCLLRGFDLFLERLEAQWPLLIGISRKSFLRFSERDNPKTDQGRARLEALQAVLLHQMCQAHDQREFVFRSHAPEAIEAVQKAIAILRP